MTKKIETYADAIRKNIEDYDGPLSDVIRYAPIFYELFESLIKEKELDKSAHSVINSVVAYFVLPNDIIPEDEYGAFGYIDDLYLCAHVVSKLYPERRILKKHWKSEENLFELASKIIDEIESVPDTIVTKEELELIRDYIRPSVKDYGLLQDKISPHLLMHLAKKAKHNNILNSKLRHLLYKFSKSKMKGVKLSSKQIIFLEDILIKAIDEGVLKAECGEDPCFKCDKIKEIKIYKKYSSHKI